MVEIGGFYVSRFWVTEENGKPVSKKGIDASSVGVYDKAGQVSRLRSFINTSYAKTSFISGAAYDTMMHFVHGKRYSQGYFNVLQKQPSVGAVTGGSSDGAVCNIYDLTVGGIASYTAEITTGNLNVPTVTRGYSNYGDVGPAYRNTGNFSAQVSCVRATLYVY